jgi:hypothetical protein
VQPGEDIKDYGGGADGGMTARLFLAILVVRRRGGGWMLLPQGGPLGGSVRSAGIAQVPLPCCDVQVTIGSSLQFGYGTGVMNNSESFIR